jgi:hypothetical protein
MSRPRVELCVGMKLRPARNRWSLASTWMQRTGTLGTGRTSVMKRAPRAVNVRAPRSLCTSFLRSSRKTSSSVLNVSVWTAEDSPFVSWDICTRWPSPAISSRVSSARRPPATVSRTSP